MSNYYADTSVLVKRHVPETGSAWVQALTDAAAGNAIVTTQLSLIEMYSALNRKVRKHALSAADYANIVIDLNAIFSTQYGLVPLLPAVINDAKDLLERHPLRAYDAVQLATALQMRRLLVAGGAVAPIFLSADDRLLAAAQAEGFVTDNPNLH